MSPLLRIAGAMLVLGSPCSSLAGSVVLNSSAPDFALKSLTGENIRLSEYRGEVVLLTFWASWCGKCRKQLEAISELHASIQDVDFEVLAVNLDDDQADALRLVDAADLRFSVLVDEGKAVTRRYDPSRMPMTILISRYGDVRHIHEGYTDGDIQRYSHQISALIAE